MRMLQQKVIRKSFFLIIAVVTLFSLSTHSLQASTSAAPVEERILVVSKDETVSGDYARVGNSITVNGVIEGDLYVLASTLQVDGEVRGDIIALAETITITGKVGGSVRAVGNTIHIDGATVERSVSVAGIAVRVNEEAHIQGSLSGWGDMLDIKGEVIRETRLFANEVILGGTFHRGIVTETSSLRVEEKATLEGDIEYTSENEAQIHEKSTVRGVVKRVKPEEERINEDSSAWQRILDEASSRFGVVSLMSALLIALLLVYAFPRAVTGIAEAAEKNPLRDIITGFLTVAITPLLIILTMATIVGLPLGVIVFALFITEMYLAKVFVAVLLGRKVLTYFGKGGNSLYWYVSAGLVIWYIIAALPYGYVWSFIGTFWGMGALYESGKNVISITKVNKS